MRYNWSKKGIFYFNIDAVVYSCLVFIGSILCVTHNPMFGSFIFFISWRIFLWKWLYIFGFPFVSWSSRKVHTLPISGSLKCIHYQLCALDLPIVVTLGDTWLISPESNITKLFVQGCTTNWFIWFILWVHPWPLIIWFFPWIHP